MRDFACPNCGQRLAFENSLCLGCNNPIGFDLVLREFAILRSDGVTTAAPARRMCANLNVAGCNWLVPADVRGLLCRSCSLTRTRPADGDQHSHGNCRTLTHSRCEGPCQGRLTSCRCGAARRTREGQPPCEPDTPAGSRRIRLRRTRIDTTSRIISSPREIVLPRSPVTEDTPTRWW